MSQRKIVTDTIMCMHCGATNPLKAYCCLTCFKVLRPKADVPFWKISLPPNVSFLLIILTVAGSGVFFLKQWMETIEAEVTMNIKTAEYNLSVVADKKRKSKTGLNLSRSAAAVQEVEDQ